MDTRSTDGEMAELLSAQGMSFSMGLFVSIVLYNFPAISQILSTMHRLVDMSAIYVTLDIALKQQ